MIAGEQKQFVANGPISTRCSFESMPYLANTLEDHRTWLRKSFNMIQFRLAGRRTHVVHEERRIG